MTANFLQIFGHPHIHGFNTVTEFRPISDGKNGITKIIPSLIVSIKIHEFDDDKMVDFQLKISDVKKLIDELNDGYDSLKTEIQDIRSKFGDNIID